MARNLRAKISIDDTILVYDLNKPVLSRFAKEAAAEQKIENAVNKQNRNNPPRDGGKCIVAASPEELVLQSVRYSRARFPFIGFLRWWFELNDEQRIFPNI